MVDQITVGDQAHKYDSRIRTIGIADLKDALARGVDDFKTKPTHAIFGGLFYPLVGLVLVRAASGGDLAPLIFPLLAGFALIGPVAALGLYELSRLREMGHQVTWRDLANVVHAPSLGGIFLLSLLLLVIFFTWHNTALGIYYATMGDSAYANFDYARTSGTIYAGFAEFIREVLTTKEGWNLILIGNGVGFLFAVFVFSISVVSFPMMLDRKIPVTMAIYTSIRAVVANPITMAVWGGMIAALLVIGSIPLLFGLAIVFPILGHASWHVYRKVVVQ